MNWKAIRLELSRTTHFPCGSASRAFLLRLPLKADGTIDPDGVARNRAHAIVRRFWASEPDQIGIISRDKDGWTLRCNEGAGEARLYRLGDPHMQQECPVVIECPDGELLPFRVASITPLGISPASAA